MSDTAPTPAPVTTPAPEPVKPELPTVTTPAFEGSPVAAMTGKEASEAPIQDNPWLNSSDTNETMRMPTVVADDGKMAAHVYPSAHVEAPPPIAPETSETPEAEAEPNGHDNADVPGQRPGEPPASFVDRANAERERMYSQRRQAAEAEQLRTVQAELAESKTYAEQNLYSSEDIGSEVRTDPFAFMRRHGVGLAELNQRLEATPKEGEEPQVNSQVFAMQQQLQAQQREIDAMRQAREQQTQVDQRQTARRTLEDGLSKYKDSYPGLHALFGAESGTSPAEQVLIGLERAHAAGNNMSADEVAGRLEREAKIHFTRLHNAYGITPNGAELHNPATLTPQHPPNSVAPTAGITNATPQPTRIPGPPRSRAEEIQLAASLLKFM